MSVACFYFWVSLAKSLHRCFCKMAFQKITLKVKDLLMQIIIYGFCFLNGLHNPLSDSQTHSSLPLFPLFCVTKKNPV